ncbi:hypothetical protein SAMN06295888_12352 [Desulfonatronum zhilinae]|nr:hypothetical protein SAMN06295888_12352 [Desulfonatronum zhilinae]
MNKYCKDVLATIVLISLIYTSIKLKYSLGYLIGFLILFLFLVLDHVRRIIFELNVRKVFGIEFGESEKKEIKNHFRSELHKKGIEIDSNIIDEITDSALNSVSGVEFKGRYYEELVSYALSDLGLPFLTDMRGGVNNEIYQLDFVVELEHEKVVGIEVAYSDRKYLSKEKIHQVIQYMDVFKKVDNISHFLLITNTEVRQQDKESLKSKNPQIDVIENTISPDGVLSQLQYYFKNIDKNKKGSLEK